MSDVLRAINHFQLTLFIVIFIIAAFYSTIILLNPRFRQLNHLLTVNFCFAIMASGFYWIYFFITILHFPMNIFKSSTCFAFSYFEMMTTIEIPLAMIVVSISQFFLVVVQIKENFHRKFITFVFVLIQWIIGFVSPIPRYLFLEPFCTRNRSLNIYTFAMVVIFPSLLSIVINGLIFRSVRASFRQIQVQQHTNSSVVIVSRRDLYVLRHFIFMFGVFIFTWSPIAIYSIVVPIGSQNNLIMSLLILLAELGVFVDTINVFIYHHELRQYLRERLYLFVTQLRFVLI